MLRPRPRPPPPGFHGQPEAGAWSAHPRRRLEPPGREEVPRIDPGVLPSGARGPPPVPRPAPPARPRPPPQQPGPPAAHIRTGGAGAGGAGAQAEAQRLAPLRGAASRPGRGKGAGGVGGWGPLVRLISRQTPPPRSCFPECPADSGPPADSASARSAPGPRGSPCPPHSLRPPHTRSPAAAGRIGPGVRCCTSPLPPPPPPPPPPRVPLLAAPGSLLSLHPVLRPLFPRKMPGTPWHWRLRDRSRWEM